MYEFINYSRFDKKDLPSFARLTFASPVISETGKMDMIQKVLESYMTDSQFRAKVQGYYIFFLDDQYAGVFIDREHSDIPLDYPGYKITRILISDNPPKYDFYSIYQ